MRKILVHTEIVKRKFMKLQLQIRLPETLHQVTGVLSTINPLHEPVEGGDPLEVNRGSLWLRASEERDVFYSDLITESRAELNAYSAINPPGGLSSNPAWWITGTKHDFFRVTVPVDTTVIEGFYIDESTKNTIDYKLRIYIELEDYDA